MDIQSNEKETLLNELKELRQKHERLQKSYKNVTHLYKQAAALRDYNEREKETQIRYNQMLRDNSPDDILLLDVGLNVILCTSLVKKRFGRDITGEEILPIIREYTGKKFTREIEKVFKTLLKNSGRPTGSDEKYELHLELDGKKKSYFSIHISPALNGKGEFTGIILLAHDYTEMYEANMRAEAAAQAKSNFLANMSHEIRTPLNAISGMTGIGRSALDPERKDYCFEKIEDATNHLLGVINDILDVSKIEAGKFELSPTEFDFEKMLRRVIDVVNFRVDEKNQILIVNIDREIPGFMIGDDQRLAQVVTNLMSNAIKFTPDEGSITINADLLKEENGFYTIKVSVSDSGIGISSDHQNRLFSSFQQAESSTARKFGGTGLGLSISKSIVEMMGGSIWVETELGKGATFSFTTQLEKSVEYRRYIPDWRETRILVVTDDLFVTDLVKKTTEMYGAYCDTADCGNDALRKIKNYGKFDVYFIDHKIFAQNVSGLKKIKREKTGDKSYVALIAGFELNEQEKEEFVDCIIYKPVFPSHIVDAVNNFLKVDRQISENEKENTSVYFAGQRILLAEDMEINREIVKAILEPAGLLIDCAENGTEAIRMFSETPERYDLIFMDVQMPEMDGYEATRFIRSLGFSKAAEIPIIAMTANVFREDVEKCLEAGMDSHIGKPLDFEEVVKVLQMYL